MNISFLNPSVLLALPIAALPIVLHLIRKKKNAAVPFSHIKFLKLAIERKKGSSRLRKLLLLSARVLFLLLIITAFAGPRIQYGAPGRAEKNAELSRELVLLIDTSFSMRYNDGGKNRFDEYILKAKKIVSLLPGSARIGVIAYSNRVESTTPGLTNDKNYILSFLSQLKPTYRTTDISCAAEPLKEFFAGNSIADKTVLLLSDLAAHGFTAPFNYGGMNFKLLGFDNSEASNLSIRDVSAEFSESQDKWSLNARVFSSGERQYGSLAISYYSGMTKIGAVQAEAPKGETPVKPFYFKSTAGVVNGSVRLTGDNLQADNCYYYSALKPGKAALCVIDGDPGAGGSGSESYYLHTAFPEADVFGESEAEAGAFEKYDVVMLLNIRDNSDKYNAYLKNGGKVMVFLGNHSAGLAQAEVLPCEIASVFETPLSVKWNISPKDFQGFNPAEFESQNISVKSGYASTPGAGSAVLAAYDSGWPFLCEGTYGRGRVLLFTTTADRDWNNLPSKPIFLPLMRAALAHLLSDRKTAAEPYYKVGEIVRRKSLKPVSITGPDGKRAKAAYFNGEYEYSMANEPGIYEVKADGLPDEYLAVNLDYSTGEDALKRFADSELREYWEGRFAGLLPAAGWEDELASILYGKELSRYLLLAALLLLIAEILLANPGVRPKELSSEKAARTL